MVVLSVPSPRGRRSALCALAPGPVVIAPAFAIGPFYSAHSNRKVSDNMSAKQKVELLTNASATGAAKTWPGGKGKFFAVGTFGGATLTLAVLGPDGATYVSVAGVSLTAAGTADFILPPGPIKAILTAGAPANMYAHAIVSRIGQ